MMRDRRMLFYLVKAHDSCCEYGLMYELRGKREEEMADLLGVHMRTISTYKRKIREGEIVCEHPGRSDCILTR